MSLDPGLAAHAVAAAGATLVLGLSLGLLRDDPQDGPSGVVAVLRPLTTDVVEFVPAEQPSV
jgi:hypothetical protein